ncbi:MAG: B12-binding domain-containing radical SAM protein [Thermoplasmata archaeon]|nr:B12-binding domain-containing radical SAM protein [Thermoplasmata archaeon]
MNANNMDDLRILLVMPSIRKKRNLYDSLLMKATMWKPITLYQIAALSHGRVKIVDENYENVDYSKYSDHDIAGISALTATAKRAYEIADELRGHGIKVVLGGYHPTALPQEAKEYADSVVIGNAEGVWKNVLHDALLGKLKSFYFSPYIENIPSPSMQPGSIIQGIEATRGCPYRCKFCAISNTPIGGRYIKKPIEQVVKEIERVGKYFIFYDSSLTINTKYTKELFREIAPLNKKFACFGNINTLARDKELLKLASEAGCLAWAVGMESVEQSTLDEVGKANNVRLYREAVRKVKEYGMGIIASIVFGFDGDDEKIFERTYDMLCDIDVDSMGVNILTPFPGTPLFDEMKMEGRILTYNWDKYDLYHVVFMPSKMSPETLLEGTKWIANQFFKYSNIARRLFRGNMSLITRGALMHHLITSRLVYRNVLHRKNEMSWMLKYNTNDNPIIQHT